jgi:acyl-CoA thioester hydrolase
MECDFFSSARFGDILEVTTKVIELKKASLQVEQLITRGEDNIFKTIVTLVFLKDGKPSRIPEEKLAIFG